ncbi:MAG: hypothetical protein AAF528_00635 [Cyanobacteria bacterium P01_C01_bin.121]
MDALCFAPSRHLLAPIGAEQPNLQTDFDEARTSSDEWPYASPASASSQLDSLSPASLLTVRLG